MEAEGADLAPGYREIPPRVNIAREVLDRLVEQGLGDRTAFVHEGGKISYSHLRCRVDRLARGLLTLGITRGTPVLLRMPNCPEFALSFLALVKIGALPVLLNSLLGREEVGYVLEHSDAEAAIALAGAAGPLREQGARLTKGLVVARGAEGDIVPGEALSTGEFPFEDLLDRADETPVETADTSADGPAFFVYTSGTTGRPKGICHAHRWIIALGDANRLRLPPEPDDVVMATGEWSFISALGHNVLFPLRNGVTGAILEGRALPEKVLEAIERYRVTVLYSVPTVYRRILAMEGAENRYDLSCLRCCNATGEPLQEATYFEWKKRFGCDLYEHYGVSEMQMVLGQGPGYPVRPGSIGKPLPDVEVEVLNEDDEPLRPGEAGHLVIRADDPGFFLRYHKDPERTAEAVREGWYHTGDLARRDEDGYFWVVGRSDECFKSRGIFISPVEIEGALRQHPSVVEAAVVPLADPEIGNRIRAIVVVRDSAKCSDDLAEQIREDLRARIAPFKIPHVIEFAESLPKSAVGKILRRELI
ncbi:MAG: acyl-CoA synthetase [Nitrospinota bacterium]